MRRIFAISSIAACLCVGVLACSDKESDKPAEPSGEVLLSKTDVSGKTGDQIQVDVTLKGDITKLVVTKVVSGVPVSGYNKEENVTNGQTYTFKEQILAGDENGTLVYSFTGESASGVVLDAADLLVKVSLSGVPLLVKHDWQWASETVNGVVATTAAGSQDDVHRFNTDYSWQYDWGTLLTKDKLETLPQYCAWKVKENGLQVDSISFIRYDLNWTTYAVTQVVESYKVTKLEGQDLWIEGTFDLSDFSGLYGNNYTANSRVIRKYTVTSKSPNFTPYRGETAENYNWGTCTPGKY